MGLGKTITCVSLIASTLASAKGFEQTPLELPPPPPPSSSDLPDASHFANSVWGMPSSAPLPTVSQKQKAKELREQESAQAQYTRACRIKAKSRATLIICPLSTVSNWEDQFREHWKGPVAVIGGSGSSDSSTPSTATPPNQPSDDPSATTNGPLRVYVYHGNARRPDPTFLANCDVVITTFSTLASEFSKQSRSTIAADGEDGSSDSGIEFLGSTVQVSAMKKKTPKRKRIGKGVEITSPLQSVHWFRVVLDEAQ